MTNSAVLRLVVLTAAAFLATTGTRAPIARGESPEGRAIAFLAAEVPKWHREHGCFSCHNNGDAVRALAVAAGAGLLRDREPLADSLRFLAAPDAWDDNGPDGPFKDKKLARIQFAAALVEAKAAGLVSDERSLNTAAELVAELQTDAGNWKTEESGNVGSPTTYGAPLASYLALRTLAVADGAKYRAALTKGRNWFLSTEPKNVLAAAATLLTLAGDESDAAEAQRRVALKLVRRGQAENGGWGPFVTSPPETFDTAVVLLALAAQRDRTTMAPLIAAGRKYLLSQQTDDGSWHPTTRPPGADSYAQRLSTTAWATLALLATRGE